MQVKRDMTPTEFAYFRNAINPAVDKKKDPLELYELLVTLHDKYDITPADDRLIAQALDQWDLERHEWNQLPSRLSAAEGRTRIDTLRLAMDRGASYAEFMTAMGSLKTGYRKMLRLQQTKSEMLLEEALLYAKETWGDESEGHDREYNALDENGDVVV